MITPAHKRELNRALHELRRPLQALVLMESCARQPAASPPAASRRGLLEVAASALQDLDGAVNGEAPARPPRRFSCREVVLAALERWRPVAARAGGIRVYWDAGPAPVEGDPVQMAQALDNLITNALEHGGPPVVVTGARVVGRIRVTIANGAAERPAARRRDPRRGHGTEVVSRVASAHRGRFAICQTGSGCVAALELPLAESGSALAA
jgi:two-component system, OmpR family, sensor histidine kinase MtrB